jgi:hypothetical protein
MTNPSFTHQTLSVDYVLSSMPGTKTISSIPTTWPSLCKDSSLEELKNLTNTLNQVMNAIK